ncbi:MAG: glutamine-hydrolyzing carbamoyl-phosphate synthase small subunit [Acholeplasmatales bacterium]|nr:glutamine-hydrolyzing carbamoyl-phosphate synthase small subunit [Acholeplasmatales bacterium]
MKRKLVLENGSIFHGNGFGSHEKKIAEIVFNTSMVGYQEILSDPSYCDQIIVMTYPLIGNYGLTSEDYESKGVYCSGFVVHEYNDLPSNFRYTQTLGEKMEESHAAGIEGIDTRELVRIIRDYGSMKAMIVDEDVPDEQCLKELAFYCLVHNQVEKVSSKKIWYSRCPNPMFTVVAIDCGCKLNIIRLLNEYKCNVVVVPYNTSVETILKYKPDGLFISNGPGDPLDVVDVINTIKTLKGKLPMLGICLGHQMIGLAYGAKTYKMKFGHRGANHPVKNLKSGKIEITSQNHSYAIDIKSLKNTDLTLTHINLLDDEAEGMEDIKNKVIAVQYHPESAAGPEDSRYIFEDFLNNMKSFKEEKENA